MDRAPITPQWRDAMVTTRGLRDALRALGIPDKTVRQILPIGDIGHGEHLRMGTWPAEDAKRLLAALTGTTVSEPAS